MLARTYYLLAAFAICLAIGPARAQEGQATPRAPGPAAPAGVDKKYFDLSHSKDRYTKALAERYLNLVKYQEWGTPTGKPIIAKYVSHDPSLSHVKLAVPKGTGKDRVVKEYDVEVEKLNKVCQSRVKQIDTLQKKLDELAETAAKQGDASGGQAGPGGPMLDERGVNPRNAQGPEGPYAGPGAPPPHPAGPLQPQATGPDPSESEPDPLGFAELPPIAPGVPTGPGAAAGAVPGSTPFQGTTPQPDTSISDGSGPGSTPFKGSAPQPLPSNPSQQAAPTGPAKPWQTDFDAFRGNFKVYPVGPGQPPAPADRKLLRVWHGTGQQHAEELDVDFGELDDLRIMAEPLAVVMGTPHSSWPSPEYQQYVKNLKDGEKRIDELRFEATLSKARLSSPEYRQKVKYSQDAEKRIGEVTWEATFRRFNGPTQPIEFIYPRLPKPLDVTFTIDSEGGKSTPEQWSSFARGDRIRFKGRLSMDNSDIIRVSVREPVKVGVSTEPVR